MAEFLMGDTYCDIDFEDGGVGGTDENCAEAFKWYMKSAKQGNSFGEVSVSMLFLLGKGVEADLDKAKFWGKKSAEQGNVAGQLLLGILYFCEENYTDGLKWLLAAERQSRKDSIFADMVPALQCSLGELYYSGEGIEQNYEEAFKWYEKAAEQGDADAQCMLGKLYYGGEGVEKNSREAFKWIEKAAEQGHADAQCSLGLLYYIGEGVERNPREAFKWYKKAADQGHEIAQKSVNNLKFFYEK